MKFKLDEDLGSRTAGIIAKSGHDTGLVRGLLTALQSASIAGRLWVVEAGRIRMHEEEATP